MHNTMRNGFNILKLIDSQTRDADLREGKQERGLAEMIRQRCPISASRAGVPLPTKELLRDLQLTTGSLSGQNAAGVVLNPLDRLAGAARPALVLEQAGVEQLNINDGQEGNIPRWRGNGGGWIQEGQTLSESDLTLSNVVVRARHCGAQVNFSRRLRLGTEGDIQELIITEMRRVVQQALEEGLIDGDGEQGKPLGLIQQGTNTVTFAGAVPTYVELTAMLEDLTDADGEALTYSIKSGNSSGLFSINPATGLISLAPGKSLDFESKSSYKLNVSASNSSNTTDSATITINVTDVADHSPSIADQSVSIKEDANSGSSILNLADSNSDKDLDADGEALTYSITSGNADNLFSINANTGLISLASGQSLDYESKTQHILTVTASDGTAIAQIPGISSCPADRASSINPEIEMLRPSISSKMAWPRGIRGKDATVSNAFRSATCGENVLVSC